MDSFQILMEQHHLLTTEFKIINNQIREKLKEMRHYNRIAAQKIEESRKLLRDGSNVVHL